MSDDADDTENEDEAREREQTKDPEEERKKIRAKKMYVIPEVDEDDYISDPNMSRVQKQKIDSDVENTKHEIIPEE